MIIYILSYAIIHHLLRITWINIDPHLTGLRSMKDTILDIIGPPGVVNKFNMKEIMITTF